MMDWVRILRNRSGRLKGYGGCYRCGNTWDWAEYHETEYTDGEACFPLCEDCWQKLTPKERLPFYDQLINRWIETAPSIRYVTEYDADRDKIRTAVMAGK